jgi:hypothetical protein
MSQLITVYTVRRIGSAFTFRTNDISNLPEDVEVIGVQEMSEDEYFHIPATNESYEFFNRREK